MAVKTMKVGEGGGLAGWPILVGQVDNRVKDQRSTVQQMIHCGGKRHEKHDTPGAIVSATTLHTYR